MLATGCCRLATERHVGCGEAMNYIHARAKDRGGFDPSSKTMCFKCSEPGINFVFLYGHRKYACRRHYEEWQEAAMKDDRILEED
jgi:hypothetical protein